jgi:EAL domain-containing protein (putative c-di-GMP-specific phosphodiesterase class I)
MAGAGHTVYFDQSIRSEFESRVTLETELRRAIDQKEFELFYQPQVDLATGALVGAEALVRWQHPEKGLIPPGDFIPVVNASSMSDQIGRWVLQTACRQGSLWQQRGHALRIGVNLSWSQIQSGDLPATVAQMLQETGLSAELLELEVTEDILLADDERARQIFSDIQKLGVNIAFDDFGTGYASLAYLKKFPLDRLKIDRSFVRNVLTDPNDAAIVDSTIRLGKQFGLLIIAEGVEDSPTADLLAQMGCEEGQGYHFGRPMPAEEFERNFFQIDGSLDQRQSGTSTNFRAA